MHKHLESLENANTIPHYFPEVFINPILFYFEIRYRIKLLEKEVGMSLLSSELPMPIAIDSDIPISVTVKRI